MALLALLPLILLAAGSGLPEDVVLPGVTPTPTAAAVEGPRLKSISVVVIDPGHGGDDAGARSDIGLVEKDLTLALAKKIETALTTETGARVLLDRNADVHEGEADRTSFANQAHADLFLSLHANRSPAAATRGFRVYYHDTSNSEAASAGPALPWASAQRAVEERSARFAELLRESLAGKVTVLPDRGIRRVPMTVLEGSTCPSVLLEVGFLSNHYEALALSTDAVQDAIAASVVEAIEKMDASLGTEGH